MAALVLALAAVLALALPIQTRAADARWTWRTSSPVEFQRITSLGTLIVSTADGLTALDPANGEALWTRGDVRRLKAPDFAALPGTSDGLLYLGEGMGGLHRRVELVDLRTGTRRWDTGSLPIESVHGFFPAPQCTLIVLVGEGGKGGGETVLGVDLLTGVLRWRQDALFKKAPRLRRVAGSGGKLFRSTLAADMPALFDGSGRMILWVSEDGPLALDLATGRAAWKCAVDGPGPSAATGHAPWMLAGRTVFAPFEGGLLAIDARYGLKVWSTISPFTSVVQRMQLTPFGLVVQGSRVRDERGGQHGKPFLDLLDPNAGLSRWRQPPKELRDAGPFAVLGETLYVAADRQLLAVAPADGMTRSIAPVPLQGYETITGLEVLDGDLVVTSSQTTMRLSPQGEKRYQRYDPAPTAPAWRRTAAALEFAVNVVMTVGAIAGQIERYDIVRQGGPAPDAPGVPEFSGPDPVLTRRYTASLEAGNCRIVLTMVVEGGREGIGLLKIDKATGQELGKLVIRDRTPEYAYDPVDGHLFFVRDDREIVCCGF